ncbi:ABC transporter substrate-binding protein [Phyllobacterium zundukense]|uniref:ABC transporter substrate-binding protein n=1 Tax=Phyllobacterium zundukense TaxID=1867719 RepID=A0ACD4D0X1_9HYPH|nr:ABC transporter substrate-binding protein [Phyllobacterium zundukense]UXN59443.1 ABC transporter substrate-binding protein [Phyllobacterium zundukense]
MRLSLISGVALAAVMAMTSFAKADIVVGIIAPVTGPVAAYGLQVKNGVESAAEAINAAGGIKGEKIVTKIFDDAGEPKQGVSVANQVVGEGIKFVVGPVTSGVAMPVSDVLAENGIVMVTPTATTPDLTTRGLETVFRTCGRDDQQADVAGKYMLDKFKDKRIAIIYDKTPYGTGIANGLKAVLNKGGVTEVVFEGINAGEKDYSALITRIKSEKADVIYFGGYHAEGGLIARQLNDQGIKAQIIGPDGLSNTEYWAIGGDAAAGTLFTNSADPTKNPAAAKVVEALQAKNIPAEAFTLNAYAALQVIAGGIEKAGSAEPSEVAAKIKSGDAFPTVAGDLSYSSTGDLNTPAFVFYKWEGGKSTQID